MQVVCDAKYFITDIVARWPGSSHDSTIFNNSTICTRFEQNAFGSGIILGDSAYALQSYLMTPLLNPVTPAENLYNESHIRTRTIIERTFGIWKKRFPILSIGMKCNLEQVQDIVVATAVLHIICRSQNVPEPEVGINVQDIVDEVAEIPPINNVPNNRQMAYIEYFGRLLQ